MRFERAFEGQLSVIRITLTLDESKALLNQSRHTWFWRRFIQLLKGYL